MIIKEIQDLINTSELVSIERDCSSDELCGIINFANDEIVVLVEYTSDGTYDGITIFEISQIESIFWGNREHLAIKELIIEQVSAPKFKFETFQEVLIEVNGMYDSMCIYEYHNESNFDLVEIIGYDQEWIKFCNYGTKKTLSRMQKIMKRESISRIAIDSPYQNKIVKLHNSNL